MSQQEDVILECIDSTDITIRIKALDLVQGMVTSDNLVPVVSRLMKQLKSSAVEDEKLTGTSSAAHDDDSDEEAQPGIRPIDGAEKQMPLLPEDYRLDVIRRILFICSKDNYSSILDFDWYIDVLTQLVRMAPAPRTHDVDIGSVAKARVSVDVSEKIGDELRNIAVKVRAMRTTTVRAAGTILMQLNSDTPGGHSITSGALISVTWILGEYAALLSAPDDSLNSLLQLLPRSGRSDVSATILHAVAKVFSSIAGNELEPWTAERKSSILLLMARILNVLEPLALDPSLEVQERAVEFVELLKLTAEAASGQVASNGDSHQDPPLLLTQAIPSLFSGWELNSVARGAQHNVPALEELDLDVPIHTDLNRLLSCADIMPLESDDIDDFEIYYHQRLPPSSVSSSAPAITRLSGHYGDTTGSYQQPSEDSYLDSDILAKRQKERLERNKDDPFYIPSNNTPGPSTPIHNILQNSNGPDLDIDSIPVMQLELEKPTGSMSMRPTRQQPWPRRRVLVASDETLEGSDTGQGRQYDSGNNQDALNKAKSKKSKQQSLLQVDSSTIGSFNLERKPSRGFDHEQQQREEAEMQQAMKEIERLRLEMQRANERIQMAQGVDAEGTIVKKKKKKTAKRSDDGEDKNGMELKPKKRKKKKVMAAMTDPSAQITPYALLGQSRDVSVVIKKTKKADTAAPTAADGAHAA